MISSQRIITMIIGINLIIGMIMTGYNNPTEYNNEAVQNEISFIENSQNEYTDEDTGVWGTVKAGAGRLYENTIGNVIKWGYIILSVFIRGINPLSINAGMFENQVLKLIANMILFTRSIMVLVVIFEIYLVFKNKKAT